MKNQQIYSSNKPYIAGPPTETLEGILLIFNLVAIITCGLGTYTSINTILKNPESISNYWPLPIACFVLFGFFTLTFISSLTIKWNTKK